MNPTNRTGSPHINRPINNWQIKSSKISSLRSFLIHKDIYPLGELLGQLLLSIFEIRITLMDKGTFVQE